MSTKAITVLRGKFTLLGGLKDIKSDRAEVPTIREFRDLHGDVERLALITARRVALRASNGKYVSVDLREGKECILNAWADAIGTWETFVVVDLGDGTIALRADNGKYVGADFDNGSVLKARGDQPKEWERFQVSHQGDAGIALRASKGTFVGADLDNDGVLKAWGKQAKEWEQFRWQAVPYEFSTQAHVAALIENGLMKQEMDRILDEKLRMLDAKLAEAREILKKIEAAQHKKERVI